MIKTLRSNNHSSIKCRDIIWGWHNCLACGVSANIKMPGRFTGFAEIWRVDSVALCHPYSCDLRLDFPRDHIFVRRTLSKLRCVQKYIVYRRTRELCFVKRFMIVLVDPKISPVCLFVTKYRTNISPS